ncbi:uncharacterized protein LOC118184400, partial [Stegodyphus dumicola]|uniref:uncharacterized protein LOC118184400 n=1 Tax=Stegodyphus dumicola TaxID=202533 RepID=UPI0015AA3A3C
ERISAAVTCNETAVALCLNPFHTFMFDLDIFHTTEIVEYELNQMCEKKQEMKKCFDSTLSPCSRREQHIIRQEHKGGLRLLEELCDRNSAARKGLVAHSNCINEEREMVTQCDREYAHKVRSQNESLSEEENRKRCCMLENYKECNRKVMITECGEEAAIFIEKAFIIAFADLNITLCAGFYPDSTTCRMYSTASSVIQGFYYVPLALFMLIRQIYFMSNQ